MPSILLAYNSAVTGYNLVLPGCCTASACENLHDILGFVICSIIWVQEECLVQVVWLNICRLRG